MLRWRSSKAPMVTRPGEDGSHLNGVPQQGGPVERWSPEWFRRLYTVIASLPGKSPEEASAVRRALAQGPVAFAVIYLEKHLRSKETGDRVTFAEVHFEWARDALSWVEPVTEPMQHRHAYIAPRSCGKSSWWFLIIPLWAAANRYVDFCASFAHSQGQAEGHLQTMKSEMDHNALLKFDYPLLCSPARRPTSGTTVADRQSMLHTASGFTFAAKGLDSASLGMKVGEKRPSVLISDDGEPDEASYSPYLAGKRLKTIIDAVFALNIYARVVMVGTVTMAGSVMHQLVKYGAGERSEALQWVEDEKIQVNHHRPIITNPDGSLRSTWPAKWALKWLISRQATREYRKNYDNDPAAVSGEYWSQEDIRYGTLGVLATRWLLQVDPALEQKNTNDWTGIAVVANRPASKDWQAWRAKVGPYVDPHTAPLPWPEGLPEWMDPSQSQCEIVHAAQVRLAGEPLKAEILRLLARWQQTRFVRVESNAGGSLWDVVLKGLPVKVVTHKSSASKEVRFGEALTYWQSNQVIHREKIPVLEDQLTGFPRTQFDDVGDAATLAVLAFLGNQRKAQAGVRRTSYA